jgi:hypothetical protein
MVMVMMVIVMMMMVMVTMTMMKGAHYLLIVMVMGMMLAYHLLSARLTRHVGVEGHRAARVNRQTLVRSHESDLEHIVTIHVARGLERVQGAGGGGEGDGVHLVQCLHRKVVQIREGGVGQSVARLHHALPVGVGGGGGDDGDGDDDAY